MFFRIKKSNGAVVGVVVEVTTISVTGEVIAEVYDSDDTETRNLLTIRGLNPTERALFDAYYPGRREVTMKSHQRVTNDGKIVLPAPSRRSGRGGNNVVPFAVRQESVYDFFRRGFA